MLLEELQPLIHWISEHSMVGGIAIFAIAFLESLAIIGLIVPGSVLMTAIGILIGSGTLPLFPSLLWAAMGAFSGDSLSFLLGHYYHERVRYLWPMSKFPKLFMSGEAFFQKHGRKSIFLARFLGPLRAIVPLIAGMLRMPVRPFLLTDFISAFFWAPAYMLPGLLLGAAAQTLPPAVATRFILLVILLIFVLWGCAWLVKMIIGKLQRISRWGLMRCWQWLSQVTVLRGFVSVLQRQQAPRDYRQLGRLFLCLLSGLLFIAIALSIKHQGVLYAWNEATYHFFRTLRTPLVEHIFIVLTLFGEKRVILPVVGLLFICLTYQRSLRAAFHWLFAILAAVGSAHVLKKIIAEARPDGFLSKAGDYAFPSGHATLSAVFFGFLTVLLMSQVRSNRQRQLWVVAASTLVFAVSLSRLYLGAHWLFDVIAGMLLGWFWVLLFAISFYRKPSTIDVKSLRVVSLGLLLMSIAVYFGLNHDKLLNKYEPRQTNLVTISHDAWWQYYMTVPVLRKNRLGKPIELMNIEWLGDINKIEQSLVQQAWQPVSQPTFLKAMIKIANKRNTQQFPILSPLYQYQRPLLMLQKQLHGHSIVLCLWRAPYQVADDPQELYFGTIYRYIARKGFLFARYQHDNAGAHTAIEPLLASLAGYHWQRIKLTNLPGQEQSVVLVE